jgi:hypothetical protein
MRHQSRVFAAANAVQFLFTFIECCYKPQDRLRASVQEWHLTKRWSLSFGDGFADPNCKENCEICLVHCHTVQVFLATLLQSISFSEGLIYPVNSASP